MRSCLVICPLQSANYFVQEMSFIGNVKPLAADGTSLSQAGSVHVTIAAAGNIAGTSQSNGYDCGCHAIMGLRALALTASTGGSWHDLPLPAGSDAQRDLEWRQQIALECVEGQIALL